MNSTAFAFNCGYARVAVRELTLQDQLANSKPGIAAAREEAFKDLFKDIVNPDDDYYHKSPQLKHGSQFQRHCEHTLKSFRKRWHPDSAARERYISTFSTSHWKALPKSEKMQHSLSRCKACSSKHRTLQETYPSKFVFYADEGPLVSINPSSITLGEQSEKQFTQCTIDTLNDAYQQQYGHSFTESLLLHCPREPIERKKTKVEKRKEKRDREKSIRDHINKQYETTAPLAVLSENESLSSYNRKRLAQSFQTPTKSNSISSKKQKTHSPSFENVEWDTNAVLADLRGWPEGKKIVWSKFAAEQNVAGRNGGQVVKELALHNGIDVNALDG